MSLKLFYFILTILCLTSYNCVAKDTRIFNGDIAEENQFPFVVGFFSEKNSGRKFCSGALIDDRWILTAAHCVFESVNLKIYIGANNLDNTDDLTGEIVTSSKYFSHPHYNTLTLANDIALILLEKPVQFKENVQPVQLANRQLNANEPVISMGWGATSDKESAPTKILNYVALQTITNRECMEIFRISFPDTMVCAYNPKKSTCSGDSGGPLITLEEGQMVHVAISIFHSGSGCEADHPSGFIRTFEYREWINNTINTNDGTSVFPLNILLLLLSLLWIVYN